MRAFLPGMAIVVMAVGGLVQYGFTQEDTPKETDDQFVESSLKLDSVQELAKAIGQRGHLVPRYGDIARETDKVTATKILNAFAELILAENAEVAFAARDELLKTANDWNPNMNVAQSVLASLDAKAETWIKSIDYYGENSCKHFPVCLGVVVIDRSIDLQELTYLRLIRQIPSTSSKGPKMFGEILVRVGLCNVGLDDEALKFFEKYKVSSFEFPGNPITGKGLASLNRSSFELLRLDGCPLTDDSLQLLKIPELKALYFCDTAISDVGLRSLNLPNLEGLGFAKTNITSQGIALLKRFPKLTYVLMDASLVNETSIESLSECKNLKEIDICGPLDEKMREALTRKMPELKIETRPPYPSK